MNVTKMKWLAALLPATFVCLFEFARHDLLVGFPEEWGHFMAAFVAAVTSLLYFHGLLALLKKLTSSLQEEKEEKAILKERDRIARELHDSVSQALFFMNIKAKEMETAMLHQRDPMKGLKELQEAIKITDGDVRQHIFNLQMASQMNVDFSKAIRSYIKKFQEQSGLLFELNLNGNTDSKLSEREKNQLIRILQEVLWNIRKHAEAAKVEVHLKEENNKFKLTIQDNGKGFHSTDIKDKGSSFGLGILQERAHSIGAVIDIESRPGKGTKVVVELNLK